ncbi:MAG: ABC transporter substrate-binding protein [Rhodobacter sp.]|nr:ABC transporter substrate-binding protein [Rhodobacter sp.]MCY4241387.1 ABC transporter substrate-binding protein [Rhodobacter sp.]
MKKLFLTSSAIAGLAFSAAGATAEEIKLGVLLGFTGPVESLIPPIAEAAEIAMREASDSGMLLGGSTVKSVRGDSTCGDSAAAVAATERMVTADGVQAIMGAACSGATIAALTNIAVPNGIVMISPASTSPALSTTEDDGLFFRTAPSDARQGQVMAEILMEEGINEVAVSYNNNDYGKGLSDSFQSAFEAAGGTVTINAAHEDGKADYSAEVSALASAGGQRLVIIGYIDQGGSGILRGALDSGAFDTFHFPDGMIGDMLEDNFGDEINGSTGQHPASDSEGNEMFVEMVGDTFDASSPYTGQAYDAAALILLAMQAAGSSDSGDFKSSVMDVANAPGEKIFPGEIAKALEILGNGGEVDYVGATAVELIGPGESAGSYAQTEVRDGEVTTVRYR